MTSLTQSWPSNLFFFGIVFAYLAPLPLGVETQPIIPLGLGLLLLAPFVEQFRRSHSINWLEAVILLLAALILFRMAVDLLNGRADAPLWAFKYLIGPFCLIVTYRFLKLPSRLTVATILTLNLVLLVAWLAGGDGGFVDTAMKSLMMRYDAFHGDRGFPFFATEPSYAANYFFLIGLVLFLRNQFYGERPGYLIALTAVLLIVTLSVMAMLFLGFLFIIFNFQKLAANRLILALASIIPFIWLTSLHPRMDHLYDLLWQSVSRQNGLIYLALSEPSASNRVIVNTLSYWGAWQSPFGNGLGSFGQKWHIWAEQLGFYFLLDHEVLGPAFAARASANVQSYFASLAHDVGLIALALASAPIVVAGIAVLRNRQTMLFVALLFAVGISALVQSQISNPALWFFIGIVLRYSEVHAEAGRIFAESQSKIQGASQFGLGGAND